MTRTQAYTIHVSNLLVIVSGLVYGWMRYFARSDDPFSVVNHPWQPSMQHLHILVAPLLVFAVGLIWSAHVWKRVRSGYPVHRKSGLALAILFFPMVGSGYFLQTSVSESWETAWRWIHVSTSIAWSVLAVVHPLLPVKTRAS